MRERIGYVHVDAGMVFVGDPCYTMPDDSDLRDQVGNWSKFVDLIFEAGMRENGYAAPLTNEYGSGPGLGLVVQSGFGDGTYPVYIERDHEFEDRPARLIVEFIPEDDDEDLDLSV